MNGTRVTLIAVAIALSPLFLPSAGHVAVLADEPEAPSSRDERLYRQMTASKLTWLMTFSPDNSKLAAIVGGDDLTGDVVIWDLKSPASWTLPREKRDGNFADYFACPTFMPDGISLVTARGVYDEDPTTFTVDLWSGESFGTRREIARFDGAPAALAISPNGKSVAASGWQGKEVVRIGVWRTLDGKQDAALEASGLQVDDVRFLEDGRKLAAVISQRSGTEVITWWDLSTRRNLGERQFPNRFLMELRTGTVTSSFRVVDRVIDGVDVHACLLDAMTGVELATTKLPADKSTFRFDEQCRRLAVGLRSGTIEVYDVATGRRLHQFTRPLDRAVSFIAFSHDGNWLSASSSEIPSRVAVWDLSEKPIR